MSQLPALFLERLDKIIPAERKAQVSASFSTKRPVSFRINSLKADADSVISNLESFKLRRADWYKDAFIVGQGTLRDLQGTPSYKDGAIYIQELSSMVPVLFLDPQPGETILDLTAAPGSKTSQISALMNNKGKILANDVSRARFFKMKANLESLGVTNVEYSVAKGEDLGRRKRERFDRVLLDAPCSGEGRFHLSDEESFAQWKLSKLKGLVPRQKMLFYSAWQALKPGGTLVYSTCTFAPEENEFILDWAFEKFPDMEIVTAEKLFTNSSEGITAWGKHTLDSRVSKALRVLPDGIMEGFFVAKLKKSSVVSLQS